MPFASAVPSALASDLVCSQTYVETMWPISGEFGREGICHGTRGQRQSHVNTPWFTIGGVASTSKKHRFGKHTMIACENPTKMQKGRCSNDFQQGSVQGGKQPYTCCSQCRTLTV